MAQPVKVTDWPGLDRLDPEFYRRLRKVARENDWALDDLLGHIWYESGFDPGAENPSSTAAGLVQFIDSTAQRFAGVPASVYANWSELNQLPSIVEFFRAGSRGEPLAGADFRLIGYGAHPDVRDEYVISERGDINPGAATDDGLITGASVRREWREKIASKKPIFGKTTLPESSPGPSVFAIAATAGLGFLGYKWYRDRQNTTPQVSEAETALQVSKPIEAESNE